LDAANELTGIIPTSKTPMIASISDARINVSKPFTGFADFEKFGFPGFQRRLPLFKDSGQE